MKKTLLVCMIALSFLFLTVFQSYIDAKTSKFVIPTENYIDCMVSFYLYQTSPYENGEELALDFLDEVEQECQTLMAMIANVPDDLLKPEVLTFRKSMEEFDLRYLIKYYRGCCYRGMKGKEIEAYKIFYSILNNEQILEKMKTSEKYLDLWKKALGQTEYLTGIKVLK